MLTPLLYCLGNSFAVQVFGELPLTSSVVLAFVALWGFFTVEKNKGLPFVQKHLCVLLGIELVRQGKLLLHSSFILCSPSPWQEQRLALNSVMAQRANDLPA